MKAKKHYCTKLQLHHFVAFYVFLTNQLNQFSLPEDLTEFITCYFNNLIREQNEEQVFESSFHSSSSSKTVKKNYFSKNCATFQFFSFCLLLLYVKFNGYYVGTYLINVGVCIGLHLKKKKKVTIN